MCTAMICTFDLILENNSYNVQTEKTMIDISGLFFLAMNWEILVSKLGKINSFWHWEWYRLLVPVI